MSKTLHSTLPVLAPVIGMTESALYERQKALVRKGLLMRATGRGRSSNGAEFNEYTASMLLAAVVFSDSLAEIRDAHNSTIERLALSLREAMARDGAEPAVMWSSRNGECRCGRPGLIVDRTLHPMAIFEVAQLLKAA